MSCLYLYIAISIYICCYIVICIDCLFEFEAFLSRLNWWPNAPRLGLWPGRGVGALCGLRLLQRHAALDAVRSGAGGWRLAHLVQSNENHKIGNSWHMNFHHFTFWNPVWSQGAKVNLAYFCSSHRLLLQLSCETTKMLPTSASWKELAFDGYWDSGRLQASQWIAQCAAWRTAVRLSWSSDLFRRCICEVLIGAKMVLYQLSLRKG